VYNIHTNFQQQLNTMNTEVFAISIPNIYRAPT
jgi:hypothetical protein